MLNIFFKFDRFVTRSALNIAILMLIVSASLAFYQVVTRFAFNQPSTWSEVIVRSAMIWSVFLGACPAFRTGSMIAVEVIDKVVPEKVFKLVVIIAAAICLIFLGVLVWFGAIMTYRVRFQMLAGLEIPISWAYVAIPIGAAASFIAVCGRTIEYFGGKNEHPFEELVEISK